MEVNLDNYPSGIEFSRKLEDLLTGESQQDITTAGRVLKKDDGRLFLYHNGSEIELESSDGLGDLFVGDVVRIRGDYIQAGNQRKFVAREATLLSKCINSLPGEVSSDAGAVNLLVYPEKRETILLRSRALKTIRSFLDSHGFIEVETPILQYYPDSAPVPTFKTEYNGTGHEYHLRICPEEFLKRLTLGFDRVYEIAKCFRNSDKSKKHSPEFTMLEFYAAFTTFEDIMALTEQLVEKVALETKGTTKLKFKGYEIDVKTPWERISVQEAARTNYGVDILNSSDEDLRKMLGGTTENLSRGALLTKFIEDKLEGLFIRPTFLTYYPFGVGVPDKPSKLHPGTMEHCEAFVARGLELANLGSINNDPVFLDRHNRNNLVNKFGESSVERYLDRDFFYEVEFGLPPIACSGIGIDRLVMLLTNNEDIKDTIAYPFKLGKK